MSIHNSNLNKSVIFTASTLEQLFDIIPQLFSHRTVCNQVTISQTCLQLFWFFSPDCTLHTAITHVISVLEWRRHTHDYAIGIHMRLHSSNTFLTWVTAECNVQSGLNSLKELYSITPHITASTVLPLQQGLRWEWRATPGTFWSLAKSHHGGHYSIFPTSGAQQQIPSLAT